jgi:hypothetical protein
VVVADMMAVDSHIEAVENTNWVAAGYRTDMSEQSHMSSPFALEEYSPHPTVEDSLLIVDTFAVIA